MNFNSISCPRKQLSLELRALLFGWNSIELNYFFFLFLHTPFLLISIVDLCDFFGTQEIIKKIKLNSKRLISIKIKKKQKRLFLFSSIAMMLSMSPAIQQSLGMVGWLTAGLPAGLPALLPWCLWCYRCTSLIFRCLISTYAGFKIPEKKSQIHSHVLYFCSGFIFTLPVPRNHKWW